MQKQLFYELFLAYGLFVQLIDLDPPDVVDLIKSLNHDAHELYDVNEP